MNENRTLVEMGYAIRRRTTGREEFLRTMNYIIPWQEWLDFVRPFFPIEGGDDRSVELLLRLYLLQKWFNIPDVLLEDSVHDSYALWLYMGVPYPEEPVFDISALIKFRQRLEESGAGKTLTEAIDSFLRRYGRRVQPGTVIDAAIVMDDADKVSHGAPEPAPTGGRQEATFTPPPMPHPAEDVFAHVGSAPGAHSFQRASFKEEPPPAEDFGAVDWKDETWKAGEEEASPPRTRVWVRRIALTAAVLILLYLFGPSLYRGVRSLLAERFPDSPWFASVQPTQSPNPTRVGAGPMPTPILTARPTISAQVADGNYYEAAAEIKTNLAMLAGGATPASIVSEEAPGNRKISLTIDGLLERESMLSLLEIASRHETKITFFISGMQAAEAPDVVSAIAQAGYPIGNYTLRGEAHMEALSPEALVESFTTAQKILTQVAGMAPKRLKGNALSYTEDVLRAAGASGVSEVVQSTAYLTYHSFKRAEEVQAWVDRLPYGSIVSVKLSGNLDASEYQPEETVERAALDLEPGAVAGEAGDTETLSPSERTLRLVEWLLKAVDGTNFSPESAALREENGGALSEPVRALRTVQPAVGYVFYGSYERPAEVDGVLKALSELGGQGTFFVTESDLKEQRETVLRILSAGHSLGIAYYAGAEDDYYGVSDALLKARSLMASEYGYEARTLMQPWGSASEAVREASSALGLMLVGQDLAFAREENRGAQTAQEVIASVYKENPEGFQRGKILGYRLGYLDREALLEELLPALEGTRNTYEIADVYGMATNAQYLYTYPLAKEDILPEVYNRLHAGQLPVAEGDLISYARGHYIGNPDINSAKQLPGFSAEEIRKLDTSGKVAGAQDVVFFTFDDWGTDVGVTKLLDVLKKHNVKATFFVRTQFVVDNPNLLRAIALGGHEVATHTDTHIPLSNDANATWTFTELTDEQAAALRKDILASWQTLQSIVGDVRLENGKPALSVQFRPPTMAVGRKGMLTAFDLGIEYIVNGEYTSRDYMAQSAADLLRDLRLNVRSGSVVIMHFSDNSVHTAEALDAYLTMNEAGQNRRTYQFARLSDYLQAENVAP